MALTHVAVAGSKRVPLVGSRLIGLTHPHAEIEVTLKLRRQQALPELDRGPAKLMSRDQLAQTYGASEDDVNKVKSVFEGLGLKVVNADAGTRSVRLAGTVEAMQNAFNVKLFDYAHPDGNYRGRVGNVQVPQEVSNIVEAVVGLDNRRVAHRKRHPQAQKVRRPSRYTKCLRHGSLRPSSPSITTIPQATAPARQSLFSNSAAVISPRI